jgi:hypothetical protein
MKTINIKWTGFRPLLMHNGQTADPTNEYSRAKKEITSKGTKKMTDSDYEQLNRLDWESGLYWDKTLGPVIPSDNIERCIQLGAQKSRIGKDVQASVFCTSSVIRLDYKGPRDKDELYKTPGYSLRKGVAVNQSRVMRVRPMFPTGWSLEFELEFDDSLVDESALVKAMINAGALVGLGDWRPKFGRFTLK